MVDKGFLSQHMLQASIQLYVKDALLNDASRDLSNAKVTCSARNDRPKAKLHSCLHLHVHFECARLAAEEPWCRRE